MPILPVYTPRYKIPNTTFFSKSNNLQQTCYCYSRFRSSAIRASAEKGKDYYSSLNLNRNATLKDIKSSYRKLARQFHPDMNKSPGAEDKFKEISAAYEVLSDEDKRSLYDRYGESGLQEEFDQSGFDSQGVDPFEVFETYFGDSNSFFGGTDFRNNRTQSLDIRYDLSLNFKESIFGGQKNIQICFFETCDNCNGSGAKSSSCVKTCVDCGGKGGVMKTQKTPFGVMSQVSTCSKCGGEGKIITDYCKKCEGRGKVQSQRSIEVVIPPGVNDGATMKVQGEGSLDKQRGIAGDLYLFVHVEEKQGIRREGVNLYSDITIDYTEAILGTVIKVETVEGLKYVRISAGSQPGDTIKLPSMGVPHFKKPHIRGDHYVVVNVAIPKEISDDERALVEKLASTRTGATSSNGASESQKTVNTENRSSLWDSIKSIFGVKKESEARFASISMGALNHRPISMTKYRNRGETFWMVVSICVILITVFIRSLQGKKRTELSKLQISLRTDTKKKKDSY